MTTARQSYYRDEQGNEYNDADLWALAEGKSSVLVRGAVMLDMLDADERKLVETMLDDYRRIQRASRMYPLILTPDGKLADGYHRLVQAIVNAGDVTFVRLDRMPPPRHEEDGHAD